MGSLQAIEGHPGWAGVDEQSLEAFEANLVDNLYKLWNRLASGRYEPPLVKRVEILKANGEPRRLGYLRREAHAETSSDFLGYTFRPRRSKSWYGKAFINFSPAISNKAAKAIRQEVRGWKLHLRSD